MNHATREFVRQRFMKYYRSGTLITPPSLEQREWGFIFFDDSPDVRMRRHMAFGTPDEVMTYLRSMAPCHVYYSTAYYALPAASTMNDKVWSGADLIFDLDADHIMRGPYDVMLARVKTETEKLLAMLTDELGFAEKDISLAFSGGRGYHVHVRRLDIREWQSQERRELIDYVCGIGIDPAVMLQGHPAPVTGWRRRYREALAEYLEQYRQLPPEDARKLLQDLPGIGRKSQLPKKIIANLDDIIGALHAGRRVSPDDRLIAPLISPENTEFLRLLREKAALADEPVTTDTKRLIRMPTSLHGGSGFRVTPLSVSEFAAFDPLQEAVVFGDNDVRIDAAMPLSMPILENRYTLTKGENTVPEALAVFLCCRGIAELAEAEVGRHA
ncbi:MAG: DNA primase small subunit PriS [Methanomicrobiales archaeon]|nr:DNA primase small subunit PriS [Methanomicrobiales archaeon]